MDEERTIVSGIASDAFGLYVTEGPTKPGNTHAQMLAANRGKPFAVRRKVRRNFGDTQGECGDPRGKTGRACCVLAKGVLIGIRALC